MTYTEVFPNDENYLGFTFVLTCAVQLSCFAIAYSCKFDLITDFAGSTNFVLLAVVSLVLGGWYTPRQIVVTAMLSTSRIELALFLLYRVCSRKSDGRFDDKRENFFKFLAFWIFQIFWVYLVSMPVVWVNSLPVDPKFGPLDYIGWAMWAFGFLVQVAADFQKLFFRKNPDNKLKVCNSGVWKYSRHPNYYGEILIWLGIFIATIPVWRTDDHHDGWASVVSPVFTILILLLLSGMPTAEGSALKRYYESGPEVKENYETYRKRTAPVIMFPPPLYAALPNCIKQWFCCEWKMYEYNDEGQTLKKDNVV